MLQRTLQVGTGGGSGGVEIKTITATSPSSKLTHTQIYADTSLYGNYTIIGISMLRTSNNYYYNMWNTVIDAVYITPQGITMYLVDDAGKNLPMTIVLMKTS